MKDKANAIKLVALKKQLIFFAVFSLLAVLLFSAACKTPWSKSEQLNPEFKRIDMDLKNIFPMNFLEGFAVLGKIDLYYGANLKKEFIGGPIVKQNKIDSMILDLQDFRTAVDPENRDTEDIIKIKDTEKTDMDLVALLIDARIKMLEAEKSIHLAYSFGEQGLAGDGYFCKEKDTIYKSLDYFEDSIKKARDAEDYMDIVLTGNPADEKLTKLIRDVLGIGTQKIPFYVSPLGEMQLQIDKDRASVDTNCKGEGQDSKVYVSYEKSKTKNLLLDITKFQAAMMQIRQANEGQNKTKDAAAADKQ